MSNFTTTKNQIEYALEYASWNWPVLPLCWVREDGSCSCGNEEAHKIGKHPITNLNSLTNPLMGGLKSATTNPNAIREWWQKYPLANIAVLTGRTSGLYVVDVDGEAGEASWLKLLSEFHDPISTMTSYTGGGGMHLFFKYPEDGEWRNTAGKIGAGIDTRGEGGYIIMPGSNHVSGGTYRWKPFSGPDSEIKHLPNWLKSILAKENEPEPENIKPRYTTGGGYRGRAAKFLEQAISKATPGNRNETGFWLSCQLRDSGIARTEAADYLREFALKVNRGDAPYSEKEAMDSLNSAYNRPAREEPRGKNNGTSREKPKMNDDLFKAVVEAYRRGELGDGELLARVMAGRIVYDHSAKEWFTWTGYHWQRDRVKFVDTLIGTRLAPLYLRASAQILEAAVSEDETNLAKGLSKHAFDLYHKYKKDNILHYASIQPELKMTGDEWDSDPWLLGVQNGVIDLKTGELREGRPEDYIKSVASIPWRGLDEPCPVFMESTSKALASEEVFEFLKRVFGYGLTGLTVEHVMVILWGEKGRNGKGTLLETIGAILGEDLSMSAPADSIMDARNSDGQSPRPFVYNLRGKRIVWTSEAKEGNRLDTALVKLLTGGDTITARTLHSKPIRFKPSHLLLMMTNPKPHIPAGDDAIWERVALVEFNQRFVDEPDPNNPNEHKRDPDLAEKLKEEYPGILAWMVRGCLEWQKEGLKRPQKIRDDTREYRDEEDDFGVIFDECFIESPGDKIPAHEAYKEYLAYCDEIRKKNPMSLTMFGREMKKKVGMENFKRETSGKVYLNYAINPTRELIRDAENSARL